MQPGTDDHSWLWTSVRNNDEQALYQLYNEQYDGLYRYGISVCHDTELTKDAINSLFAEIWQKRNTLPELDNVKGYIFIWFKRKLFKQLKGKKSGQFINESVLLSQEPEEISYEEILIGIENDEIRKEKIRRALDSLTPRQKELIQLRFFEDLSFEEIAEKTNTSIRTIYNTLHAAINRLKTEIRDTSISLLFIALTNYF